MSDIVRTKMKIKNGEQVLWTNTDELQSQEWEFFLKLIEVMEPEFLLGILEHYDLWNWM